jgi:glutamine---fructose-6-phosphate transaminase (isomerizing)
VVEQEREMSVPLVENIRAQPEAIRTVAAYHFGEGKDALFRSAAVLRSGRRIILSGMGASLSACIPVAYYLASKGDFVSVIETSELLYSYASAIEENTAVILVSRSGESVEVTKLLPILKQRNASVIGVTNIPGSTLAASSTESVSLHCPPDQLVAIQSYTGSIVVLLLLGAAFGNEFDATLRAELDAVSIALSKWIPECFASSAEWPAFFRTEAPLYLLGRGASLASVAAGVLAFQEIAKASAIGMSSANFRHGPVEVVDDQFQAIVFGSQKRTADLDAALAEDVSRIKGNVRWLGPPVSGRKLVPLCAWPANVPDRFASVFEVIPMQIAACQLAERRGIIPGEFRHAPAITLSETGFSAARAV